MPEGDVVLLTARRLDAALRGRQLDRAELRWPTAFEVDLVGRTVLEVAAYGKHLLTRFDDARTLRTHLRMDGTWRIARSGSPQARARNPRVRAVLANATWTCVGTDLGMLDVVRTRDERTLLGDLGPDLLADGFDRPLPGSDDASGPAGVDVAAERILAADAAGGFRREHDAADGAPLAELLLSQRGVAGLGTIYTAETLFAHRLWPWTAARAVGPDGVRDLLLTARRLELDAVASGPQFQERYVHGREGRPCRICGTAVQVGVANRPPYERPVFWCPVCQAPGQPTGARSSGAP
ncbi:endonuclease VIII Nei2 [Luteimicrobium xylanilyticum]|uniref:DNA-(apurinic or apyrimidinic site) lyase n=1 Tax=Luteimicrobium xylanilyticum TaxID=1133546 RepID=A0A5P9Q926_9MICO|nr:DNA-formamidopyrimidine glycosylase family protein [Luteimicrobium xylanilyticum]QFU97953.1 putative endonuclease 8 [Luteimicrobium xylanilyticum]